MSDHTTTAAAELTVIDETKRAVYADILSQAVTGELIGMQNYAAMTELQETAEEQEDCVAHANNERAHANVFRKLARDLAVNVTVNIHAPYWQRIRTAFLRHVRAGDNVACLIIQELMLESFAVSMYDAVADVSDGRLATVFRAIAREEDGHLDHALEELIPFLRADRDGFEERIRTLHYEVMTILAEMVASRDPAGHCGLCHGDCVKDSLHHIGLSAPQLRGKALNFYLRALDRLGVRGERSAAWVADLPV
jgi:rubrerythrin